MPCVSQSSSSWPPCPEHLRCWRRRNLSILAPASTVIFAATQDHDDEDRHVDRNLEAVLAAARFTGEIQQTYQRRITRTLGRPINPQLANLGRLLWFDKFQSLGRDNTCGGCHSPTNGIGDSQPIAIGVQNNNVVGPHRAGPRNQRRTPTVVNTALYPNMMWNSRFASATGDPFDNSLGFSFPVPEDSGAPNTPFRFSHSEDVLHGVRHLLQAQAHMPPTELIEVAGFRGTCANGVADPLLGPRFCQFDDGVGPGQSVPLPDASGFRNEPIRQATLAALNGSAAYRQLFQQVFPETRPPQNKPIDFFMFGQAIAEFEFTLVFADAPLDRFARGDRDAMTQSQKRGALCSSARRTASGATQSMATSNEMFSDFQDARHRRAADRARIRRRIGQRHLRRTWRRRGLRPARNSRVTRRIGTSSAPLRFATSPWQPAFFHNGAYTRLDDAIRFHLNVVEAARNYDPVAAGLPSDLTHRVGPPVPSDSHRPAGEATDTIDQPGISRSGPLRGGRSSRFTREEIEPVRSDSGIGSERAVDDDLRGLSAPIARHVIRRAALLCCPSRGRAESSPGVILPCWRTPRSFPLLPMTSL